MKLPAEIRTQIYHNLLSPEYTKVEPSNSRHHRRLTSTASRLHTMGIEMLSRAALTRFHSYRFHTQIIRTCKDISREASCLFIQQNQFVTFRCFYPGFLIEKIESNLLPLVAKDHTASGFPRHTTVITLRPWRHSKSGPVQVVFTLLGEYLPAFVTVLLAYEKTLSGLLKESALTISINESCSVGAGVQELGDVKTLPARSTTRRLLEPLCGLHSMRSVEIIGPVSDQYIPNITSSITIRRPTGGQTITKLCSDVHNANKTSKSGE